MSQHDQRLSVLRQRGWMCPHPDKRHDITPNDGLLRSVVHLEGTLWGNQQDVFLSVSDGLVMLHVDKRDVCFEEFLRWLDMESDPAEVVVKSDRQRGLFGEDD